MTVKDLAEDLKATKATLAAIAAALPVPSAVPVVPSIIDDHGNAVAAVRTTPTAVVIPHTVVPLTRDSFKRTSQKAKKNGSDKPYMANPTLIKTYSDGTPVYLGTHADDDGNVTFGMRFSADPNSRGTWHTPQRWLELADNIGEMKSLIEKFYRK